MLRSVSGELPQRVVADARPGSHPYTLGRGLWGHRFAFRSGAFLILMRRNGLTRRHLITPLPRRQRGTLIRSCFTPTTTHSSHGDDGVSFSAAQRPRKTTPRAEKARLKKIGDAARCHAGWRSLAGPPAAGRELSPKAIKLGASAVGALGKQTGRLTGQDAKELRAAREQLSVVPRAGKAYLHTAYMCCTDGR